MMFAKGVIVLIMKSSLDKEAFLGRRVTEWEITMLRELVDWMR